MKKTIRIFCLPSHATKDRTSGVDMIRIIQPMNALNGYEDEEVKFKVDVWQINKPQEINWIDVAKQYDIIYLNYIALAWAFAGMGAMARHWKRKIVMDTDDDLHSIQTDNPAYKVYHKGSTFLKDLTAIYNECDYLTTTNTHLKNVLMSHTNKRHDQIKVFPNYIDLDNLYTHRSPFKDTLNIQLGWYGSTTHFIDLDEPEFMKGVDMIFKEYPNVTFKTVGALMPKYKMKWGQRYINAYGDTVIYKWVKGRFVELMDETDIMVIPLQSNIYTKSKSDIKRTESSSTMKPVVAQDMRQYRECITDGVDGMLCSTAQDWYSKIKRLIEDKKLRRKMGIAGFERVKRDKQMKNHIFEYSSFFKKILLDN